MFYVSSHLLMTEINETLPHSSGAAAGCVSNPSELTDYTSTSISGPHGLNKPTQIVVFAGIARLNDSAAMTSF